MTVRKFIVRMTNTCVCWSLEVTAVGTNEKQPSTSVKPNKTNNKSTANRVVHLIDAVFGSRRGKKKWKKDKNQYVIAVSVQAKTGRQCNRVYCVRACVVVVACRGGMIMFALKNLAVTAIVSLSDPPLTYKNM